jgi:thiol-disulfide isomerase/thioredoxin
MKRYFLSLPLFLTLLSAAQTPASNEFVLSGEIKDSKEKFAYLFYTNKNGDYVRDSCRLQNGHFSFKGSISEPTIAMLRTNTKIIPDTDNRNIIRLFLEPVNMIANIVYDHFYEMTVTGSKTNDEFFTKAKSHQLINEKYSDSLYERHSKITEDYIFNHSNSYVSAHALFEMRGRWSKNSVEYLYSRLHDKIKNSVHGRQVKATLDELDANSEGRKAHDFIAKDVQGKNIHLSDFKGKYVLLDFWGSWCAPCRESSPHLIELFKKYSGKGFTVVGIATEYEKTDVKWKEAIQKDGTGIWYNVLSNPFSDSTGQFTKEIAGIFGVHVFPTKILIDPCGYIIGRFKGTEEDAKLDDQLKQIFN